ncbi:hypothetical protein ACTXT7_017414 [Hymenolepis weldensis]
MTVFSTPPVASVEKLRQRSRACGGCRFCLCSFLLIFVIILAIVAAVIMAICSLLAAELCPYVSIVKGINQSDYVLNNYIKQQWPPIQSDLLDMPAPNNVLFAIDTTCNPAQSTDPKLLPSVGVNRITNLNKLSEDPAITEQFTEMSKEMADKISESIKPEILTTIDQLKNMTVFLEAFLQKLEARKAVEELKKFTTVDIEKLRNLKTNVQDNKQAGDLENEINKLQILLPETKKVQDGYEGLTHCDSLPTELDAYLNLTKDILQVRCCHSVS